MTDVMDERRRRRPYGPVRIAAQALTPMGRTAARVSLERQAGLRGRRLVAAARDGIAQRRRSTRPRMRALALAPGAKLRWREVPAPPPPGPDAALVHPIATATCDLDRALALGATPFVLPLHFGHECVAEVVAVGERVAAVRPGERVVVPFQISCGTCRPCRAGFTSNCASVPPISMYGFGVGGGHWGGALSDLLAVPYAEAMLVPLPDGIAPADAASVSDNVCDGHRHVAPHLPAILEREPDAEVLIIAGMSRRSRFSASVSLYAGLAAHALGARRVRLVDARPGVRAHAERLGLTALEPSDLGGLDPAPLVIDSSASRQGLRAALRLTAEDGICTSSGGLHASVRIPSGLMYARNVTYHVGRSNARALIPQVLELMAARSLRPGEVTTTLGRLEEAPRVLREHVLGDATKTILVED
jgi:alcohol dehydrogenase